MDHLSSALGLPDGNKWRRGIWPDLLPDGPAKKGIRADCLAFIACRATEVSQKQILADRAWRLMAGDDARIDMERECDPKDRRPFRGANPERLYGSALRFFAAGFAAGHLRHFDTAGDATALGRWLCRYSTRSERDRQFWAELDSLRGLDLPGRVHRVLAFLPDEAARFTFWLHLRHFLPVELPRDFLPESSRESVQFPTYDDSKHKGGGSIYTLTLTRFAAGPAGLYQHPDCFALPMEEHALRPCGPPMHPFCSALPLGEDDADKYPTDEVELDFLGVIFRAYWRANRYQMLDSPVVWNLSRVFSSNGSTPDPEGTILKRIRTLSGQSHTLAACVGLRALAEGLNVDPDCVMSAYFGEDRAAWRYTNPRLIPAKGEEDKAEAACRWRDRSRLLLAESWELPCQRQYESQELPGRQTTLVRHERFDDAYEDATGLARGIRHYLKSLEELPERWKPPYFENRAFPGKGGVYVETSVWRRSVVPEPHAPGQSGGAAGPGAPSGQKWGDLWPNIRHAAIIFGSAGEGKTVTALMTVRQLAAEALSALDDKGKRIAEVAIPVWLPGTGLEGRDTLNDAIDLAVGKVLTQYPSDIQRVSRYIRSEHPDCWLVLDGLDRLASGQRSVVQELTRLEDGKWKLLLTSRPVGGEPDWLGLPDVELFDLAPLTEGDVEKFLERWFGREPSPELRQAIEAMGEICRNPLQLTLACCAKAKPGRLGRPVNRAQLRIDIVRDLISGVWQQSGRSLDSSEVHRQMRALRYVAWELFKEEPAQLGLNADRWADHLQSDSLRESNLDASSLIRQWLDRRLLVEVEVRDIRGEVQPGRAFEQRWVVDSLVAARIDHLARLGGKRTTEGAGWAAEVARSLGRAPAFALDVMDLLADLLEDSAMAELTREVILAVPEDWQLWTQILRRLLGRHDPKQARSVFTEIAETTRDPALNIHPEAVLARCYEGLRAVGDRSGEAFARECGLFAERLERGARRRSRFWCHSINSDPMNGDESQRHDAVASLHEGPVLRLVSAGAVIVSLGSKGSVAVWDTATGAIDYPGTADPATRMVSAFALTPGGRLFLGALDGSVLHCLLAAPGTPRRLYREKSPVTAILVVRGGRAIVVGHADGVIVSVELGPDAPVELGRHAGAVRHLVELPDDRVASGGDDGVVGWWDLPWAGSESHRFSHRYGPVRGLAWCKKHEHLVSGHSSGVVASGPVGGKLTSRHQETWPITDLAVIPGAGVFAGDNGGNVWWVDTEKSRRLSRHFAAVAGIAAGDGRVVSVDEAGGRQFPCCDGLLPGAVADSSRLCRLSGGRFAFGKDSGEVELFTPGTRPHERSVVTGRTVVAAVTPRPTGPAFAAATREGTVVVGGHTHGQQRRDGMPAIRVMLGEPINALAAVGDRFAVGTESGKILLWSREGDFPQVVAAGRGPVTALAWWEAANSLAFGDTAGRVFRLPLSELDGGKPPAGPYVTKGAGEDGHAAGVRSIEPVGQGIAAVHANGTVAYLALDGDEFKPLRLRRHTEVLLARACGNGQLALGLADGSVGCVGVSQSGADFRYLREKGGPSVRALACWTSASGLTDVVSGHTDGSVHLLPPTLDGPKVAIVKHRGRVTCLATSIRTLASCGADRILALRERAGNRGTAKYLLPDPAAALAWLSENYLVVGTSGGEVIVLHVHKHPAGPRTGRSVDNRGCPPRPPRNR